MAQPTLTIGRLITIYRVHAGDHRLAIGKSIIHRNLSNRRKYRYVDEGSGKIIGHGEG